ncbi:MAG: hypothetical protein WCV41_02985, partial [Patescibacteria group bacterium]
GEYPLTLILTDNDGAILTQPYILNVVGLSINVLTDSLSKFDLNEPYSDTIDFNFVGYIGTPTITGLPEVMTSEFESKSNRTVGYFSGSGHIKIIGNGKINPSLRHYDIKVFIPMDGYAQNKIHTYSLDINDAVVTESLNNVQTFSQSTIAQNENDKFNKENIIKIFIEEERKFTTIDSSLSNKLKGRILLQVENHGEAWYINPKNSKKYYMADGDEAYNIMRDLGVGITNKDLEKIKTDKNFAKKHSGKIFLQVEDKGQAYYIDFEGNGHYLKDGGEAYKIMRELGLGITNNNIRKIDIEEIK